MSDRPVSLEFEVTPLGVAVPGETGDAAGDQPSASTEAERIRIDAPSWRALGAAVGAQRLDGVTLFDERLTDAGGLEGCLACGHPELFTQRDFPRALGLLIVVGAAVLAPFTAYISLGVAALLDRVLYHTSRRMLVCYVCTARHRGFHEEPEHPRFDHEIAERLRFGERAVMGKPMRVGGTAGAPDPEH